MAVMQHSLVLLIVALYLDSRCGQVHLAFNVEIKKAHRVAKYGNRKVMVSDRERGRETEGGGGGRMSER